MESSCETEERDKILVTHLDMVLVCDVAKADPNFIHPQDLGKIVSSSRLNVSKVPGIPLADVLQLD